MSVLEVAVGRTDTSTVDLAMRVIVVDDVDEAVRVT